MFEIEKRFREELGNRKTISYEKIREIADAFQVASGQGFAIGHSRAILSFLKDGNALVVEGDEKNMTLGSPKEFASLLKDLDPYIDLEHDKDFEKYFY